MSLEMREVIFRKFEVVIAFGFANKWLEVFLVVVKTFCAAASYESGEEQM